MKKSSILAVFLIAFFAFSAVEVAVSTGNDLLIWSPPRQLVTGPPDLAGPTISHDSSGKLWVLFTTEGPGSTRQLSYMTSTDLGVTWSSPQPFPPAQAPANPHYIADSCLFQDSHGRLWAAWGRWTGPSEEDIYFSTSNDLGVTWSDSRLLVSYPDVDGSPCFAEIGNEVWLFFSSWGISYNWDIYYIKTSDGGLTWSSPQGVVVDSFRHDCCSVLRDSAGKVWLVYSNLTSPYDPHTSDLWYITTVDNGQTWSLPKQLTSFPSEEEHPTIVQYRGVYYVFYFDRYSTDVLYVASDEGGSTWSTVPGRINDPTVAQHYLYATVIADRIFVVWQSKMVTGNMDILMTESAITPSPRDGTTWIKYSGNPLDVGLQTVYEPWVIYDGQVFKMWYTGVIGSSPNYVHRIYYATSPDGINWIPHGMVLDRGVLGSWDDYIIRRPLVLFDGSMYRMWYQGYRTDGIAKIGCATSSDGITWIKNESNPVLVPGENGGWDDGGFGNFDVIFDGIVYRMWYEGHPTPGGTTRIGFATSSDGISWTKYPGNPVMAPGPAAWESRTIQPGAVYMNGSCYFMLYIGQGYSTPVRVGLATSLDGLAWSKYERNPVLDVGPPSSWDSDGVRASCVVRIGNTLLLYYWGGDGITDKIGLATSCACYLTMSSNFGTVTPSSGWYLNGTVLTIQATAPFAGAGERYVWNGWTGTGTGSYTGMDNPAISEVAMNGPINETASWTHQFYLAVNSSYGSSSGSGWYDSTAFAPVSTAQYVVINPEVSRYSFTGWTTTDMSEITDPSLPSTTVLMDKAKTVTADYVVQYNPTARFTWSPPLPRATKTVTFNASTSTPNTGTIVSYIWNFGDANITTTTKAVITHCYTVPKRYNVTLTVLNSAGLTNTVTKIVKITCVADINMDGKVDIRDLAMVVGAFGSRPGCPRWNPDCDMNGDNKIDIRDLAYVCCYFGWHDP
jgi:hypothetical protein